MREDAWDPSTNLFVNDPYRHALPIRAAHLRALGRADERVYLTTAYFVPGPAYREALANAAGRGVDVQVLIPERSNHALVDCPIGDVARGQEGEGFLRNRCPGVGVVSANLIYERLLIPPLLIVHCSSRR